MTAFQYHPKISLFVILALVLVCHAGLSSILLSVIAACPQSFLRTIPDKLE